MTFRTPVVVSQSSEDLSVGKRIHQQIGLVEDQILHDIWVENGVVPNVRGIVTETSQNRNITTRYTYIKL